MNLTEQQEIALSRILHHSYQRPFFLGGYAGTGKTTMLKALTSLFPHDKVLFLSPTGKACQVLSKKLPESKVRTLHSALYAANELTDEEVSELQQLADDGNELAQKRLAVMSNINGSNIQFVFSPCEDLFNADLVIVDEASMVGHREYRKLLECTTNVVFVGDPFQLPPVQSEPVLPEKLSGFDYVLTEVHRASLESPITRAAMDIRNFSAKSWNSYGSGIICTEGASLEEYQRADQILTGMNKTRQAINRKIRNSFTTGYLPVAGDKMIVKQNVRVGKGGFLFVNGDIGTVKEVAIPEDPKKAFSMQMRVDYKNFDQYLHFQDSLLAGTYATAAKRDTGILVDYGYAVTVHASQGSEWDNVMIVDDEMRSGDSVNRARWLYTAVTRAKNTLHVVKLRKN